MPLRQAMTAVGKAATEASPITGPAETMRSPSLPAQSPGLTRQIGSSRRGRAMAPRRPPPSRLDDAPPDAGLAAAMSPPVDPAIAPPAEPPAVPPPPPAEPPPPPVPPPPPAEPPPPI